MKTKLVRWNGVVLALAVGLLSATARGESDVETLKRQFEELKANFDRTVAEQRKIIETLQQRVDQLQAQTPPAVQTAAPAATPQPVSEAETTLQKPWSPSDPIRVGKGSAYMDIGVVATFVAGSSTADDIKSLELGGHDPNQRGFTVQGVELNLRGAVDPYFTANVNTLFQIDSDGETVTELEEAWVQTMSLPYNLTVRGGQFFTEFGRINTQHLHSWGFVDVPLVNGRFLGPDGLRNPGAQLSWLAPTPFYSEIFFSVQNSQGETAYSFRGDSHGHDDEEESGVPFTYRHADNDRGVSTLGDMLYTVHLATSFDLTDNQVLLLGASAAFGPNNNGESGDTCTQIYGVDMTWKWKSPNAHGGFPFVAWQTEAMLRRYDAGAFDWTEVADEGETPIVDENTGDPAVLSRETLTDYGFYTQLLWGFRKGWVAGMRLDYVTGKEGDYEKMNLSYDGSELGRDPARNERWRLSPNLTWYPSEFSKIRLQYNYDDRRDIGCDHSVWLQFEFLLGAHAAHKF
ncbi:MAG TPA: TonB-dependent receptor [Verrucomicrobiota bacterium]|nr:TonB-dependent receptor [Verrucomicrobiota bacterium]